MNENEFDLAARAWLEDGPIRMSDHAVLSALEEIHTTRRRGSGWRGGFQRRTLAVATGGAALVLVVAGAVGLSFFVDQQPGSGAVSPSPSTAPASPDVFTEIAPGEMVEFPDWPLTERTTPPMVWTGAELIAWGDGIYGLAGDGAAFNLANGTWRVLADAPLSPRSESAVAWTGTEMIVWGGRVENSFYYDGAAYDPVTDTWRLLPPPPAVFAGKDPSMLWTGDDVVVFGAMGDSDTYGEYIGAAAYDPVTDSWRSLAKAPDWVRVGGGVWWTGDSIVVAEVGQAPALDRLARYEMAADQWTLLDVGSSAAVVGVPGADGTISTFVNLSSDTGAAVKLIDSTGSLLAELPAFPGDPGVFGDIVGASGLWVGEEAVFEIWNDGPDYQPEQIWALNPSTRSWRRLDADTAFPRIDHSTSVAGDLLLTWNRPSDVYQGPPTTPRVCCVAPPSKGGSIYRVGTTSPSAVP
jgi:hypothetical protein